MASTNIADEMSNIFPHPQRSRSNSNCETLEMHVYSFDPHNEAVDETIKRRMRRRVHTTNRLVTRNLVLLPSHALKSDHTVRVPFGTALKKIKEQGNVVQIRCSRKWSIEETRLRFAAVYRSASFHFLRPFNNALDLRYSRDISADKALNYFSRSSNIYVLQVTNNKIPTI
jgi:hypothetical protein